MEHALGEIEVKSGIEIKRLDADGAGLARIATLSAVDGDGDTYAPGAFGEQTVKVLAAHDWTTVPIGKARVFEDGDEALAEFQLNLNSETAREWHAALKFDLDAERSGGRPLQEWSYGFRVTDSETETRDGERVRVLKRLKVHEISPVVVGTGVATATLALKAGRPFREQIAAVKAAVEEVAARAAQVAALRAPDGRTISAERREQLADLATELEAAGDELAAAKAAIGALALPDPGEAGAAGRELARTARTLSRKHLGPVHGGCCKVDGTRIKGRRLGALLRRLRDEQELSNEDLARAAGIDVSTMGAILAGDINCPPLRRLNGLARRLDVPVSRLRGAAEEDGCEYE